MSDDLISRRSLIIRLKNGSVIPFSKMLLNDKHKQILEFEDMVKTQPIAYDVEKVIQQLEENKESVIKTIEKLYGKLATLEMADPLKELIEEYTRQQIEIVKSGGIE